MKNLVLIAATASIMAMSCAQNPDGEKADTQEAIENVASVVGETYVVDTQESSVIWTGSKVTGSHNGTVKLKSGEVIVENGLLTGGGFVIDMTSIDNKDLEGEWKQKLEDHLKSDDFFAVSMYGESTFEITSVENDGADLKISGNLTIKGIAKNITFKATSENITDDRVIFNADFNIAREDWGVSYAGQKDDLISKEINFKIRLVANK